MRTWTRAVLAVPILLVAVVCGLPGAVLLFAAAQLGRLAGRIAGDLDP